METNKIIFFRNFLFRTFLISVLFAIFLAVVTFAFWDSWVALLANLKIEEKELTELTLTFFLHVRILLVFILLAPTLSLHWMVRSQK
ncbi:MAG: hypothetical protein AABY93_03605 [Bacteroidota bacterium]